MKYWPVPNSFPKIIPKMNNPGSFWYKRDDRYHCGIDIYAPVGSEVISVNEGYVIETGIFTHKDIVPYWNETRYITIKNNDGFFCRYAELRDVEIKQNEHVKAGQLLGHVGLVLNKKRITDNSPSYIKNIRDNNNLSMLHFEVYSSNPKKNKKYLGGNWFGKNKPKNIIDPYIYLKNILFEEVYDNYGRKDIIEKA